MMYHEHTDQKQSEQGFTVIELVVYLTIASIAIVVLTNFMVSVVSFAAGTRIQKELQDQARLVMQRITQDFRTAQQVVVCTPNALVINTASGATSCTYCTYECVGNQMLYNGVPIDSVRFKCHDPLSPTPVKPFECGADQIKLTLELEQKNAAAAIDQAYGLALSSTVVRRRSVY